MTIVFRRIYSAILWVLIGAVVLLAILLAGVQLVGLKPYVVLSGSMEPEYPVGSLLYVQEAAPESFQVGDPVTYRMPDGAVVTHRIVEILTDEQGQRCYRTKGDANNIEDGILQPQRIIGKPVYMIPYLGYVSVFVQNPPGTYVTISACLVLLVLSLMTDALFPTPKKPAEEPESPPTE